MKQKMNKEDKKENPLNQESEEKKMKYEIKVKLYLNLKDNDNHHLLLSK